MVMKMFKVLFLVVKERLYIENQRVPSKIHIWKKIKIMKIKCVSGIGRRKENTLLFFFSPKIVFYNHLLMSITGLHFVNYTPNYWRISFTLSKDRVSQPLPIAYWLHATYFNEKYQALLGTQHWAKQSNDSNTLAKWVI